MRLFVLCAVGVLGITLFMAVPHVFGAPDVPVSRVSQMLLLPMLPSSHKRHGCHCVSGAALAMCAALAVGVMSVAGISVTLFSWVPLLSQVSLFSWVPLSPQ